MEKFEEAEKMFTGMLLLVENVDAVIKSGMVRQEQKHRLRILQKHCDNFLSELWENLGPKAEIEFQKLVRDREEQIENMRIDKFSEMFIDGCSKVIPRKYLINTK